MEEISAILAMVWEVAGMWKDMSLMAQIANVMLVVIAIWKTSIARPLWDKLGAAKVLVAPALGFAAAVLLVEPFSWSAVLEGLQGGVLAAGLHHLLDAIKSMPKIGDVYVKIIEFFQKILGGKGEA